ncbi:MAG TPA: acetyl-CoA carboxylase biotin carboxyl carrier protein [Thermoanaerobaculia bacterium]|jgi:acetyl-CoA carboxylase biotin carboxyl carrier protein
MLSFKEIKDLIDLVAERGLLALEIEQTGFRIRIEGARAASNGTAPVTEPLPAPGALPAATSGGAAAAQVSPEEQKGLHVITSPIVGTFYRAPSPEADPFAEVGQKVPKGKTLCIIESMKLMNEIESDVEGEIVEVFPLNGQPVEYGEKLFAIRLAA